jgi:hypothetical protein
VPGIPFSFAFAAARTLRTAASGNYGSYDSDYGDPYYGGYYSPRIYFGSFGGDYGGYQKMPVYSYVVT